MRQKTLFPIKRRKKRSEQDSPLRTVVGVLEDAGGNRRRGVTRFLTRSWPHDRLPSIDSYTDALANVGNSKIQYTKPTTISCLLGPRRSLAKISTVFPPVHWKEPTTKLKLFRRWHMVFGTWNSSSSKSRLCMKPSTL